MNPLAPNACLQLEGNLMTLLHHIQTISNHSMVLHKNESRYILLPQPYQLRQLASTTPKIADLASRGEV